MRHGLFALALALPLGACISVLPKPPPAPLVYSLTAAAPSGAPQGEPKPVVIAVDQPATPRTLSGVDIVWMKDARLASIDGAAWDGRTPALLQTLMVLTIDRSGAGRGAVRSGEARADSEITWDLIDFGIVEQGAAEARLTAHVNLLAPRDRRLIASLEVDERAPLKDRSSSGAAAALQNVARTAAVKIAAWANAATPLPTPSSAPPPKP